MAYPTGVATYKKKVGLVSFTPDGRGLLWTPDGGLSNTSPLLIPIDTITNLQATPPSSAKVMIKIFAIPDVESPTEQYVFTFTSNSDARNEADGVKDALTAVIQASKALSLHNDAKIQTSLSVQANIEGADKYQAANSWSNEQFQNDMSLQQAVLSSSTNLQKTFHEAVVEGNVSAAQFWSSRMHLLRTHAMEQLQSRGAYNVLAEIKPKTEDAVVRVSLSRDQIHDIFEQHPLVKKVYDEVVPKLREDEFWRRFFLSRLYKKLKGEKIIPTDGYDDILDQFLKVDSFDYKSLSRSAFIPHTIDLEANEENHSQRKGNRPDLTMRPNKIENVPIIRTLNSLSMKLVDAVQPIDLVDEANDRDSKNIASMQLTDLTADPIEENILLRVRDQREFFDSDNLSTAASNAKSHIASIAFESALRSLQDGTKRASSHSSQLYVEPDDSENAVGDVPRLQDDVPSDADQCQVQDIKGPLRSSYAQIIKGLNMRRNQSYSGIASSKQAFTFVVNDIDGLSQSVMDSLLLTHATSTEFLRHFWSAFLSGDLKRTNEIRSMTDSLSRALQRIEAIADVASLELKTREDIVRLERAQREKEGKKRKKSKQEMLSIVAGKDLVDRVLSTQIKAINNALYRYQQALEDEAEHDL